MTVTTWLIDWYWISCSHAFLTGLPATPPRGSIMMCCVDEVQGQFLHFYEPRTSCPTYYGQREVCYSLAYFSIWQRRGGVRSPSHFYQGQITCTPVNRSALLCCLGEVEDSLFQVLQPKRGRFSFPTHVTLGQTFPVCYTW